MTMHSSDNAREQQGLPQPPHPPKRSDPGIQIWADLSFVEPEILLLLKLKLK